MNEGLGHLQDSLRLCFRLFRWLFLLCVIGFALSGLHTVPQGKVARVMRLGEWTGELQQPGVHLAFPSFIDRVVMFDLQRQRKLEVKAFSPPDFTVRGTTDLALLTAGAQMIHSVWTLTYDVETPSKVYEAFGSSEDEVIAPMIQQWVQSSIVRVTARFDIDRLLLSQQAYRQAVLEDLERKTAPMDLGLDWVELTLDQLAVPESTRMAFEAVQQAVLNRDKALQDARNQALTLQRQLIGERSATLGQARSRAQEIQAGLKAEAKNLEALVTRYSPELRRTYLDLKREQVITRGLDGNGDQTFWVMPEGELRLKMSLDPTLDELRKRREELR